jgi:ATP-dependent DNA helicase RecQ
MDVKISVTSQTETGTGRPLRLEVFGLCLELPGITDGSLLTVSEGPGGVTVSFTGPQEAQQPSADARQVAAVDTEPVYPQETQHTADDLAGQATGSDIEVCDSETVGSGSAGSSESAKDSAEQQAQLFQKLAALRKKISSEVNLPPYIIFHDSTLKEMCRVLPSDLESLNSVQGVGKAKLDRYGELFLAAIREHTKPA